MRTRTLIITGILSLSLSNTSFARDIVIALSPHLPSEEAKTRVIETLKFASGLAPGDVVHTIDGYHQRSLGTFTVPDDPRYTHPKARLSVNQEVVSALMAFAKSAEPENGDTTRVGGALGIPQTLRFIKQSITSESGLDVILLGSPLHDDPKDPAFSMAQGHVPSDGHLMASRADTPFGSDGAPVSDTGMRLHIGIHNDDVFLSDQHRHFVQRFWSLYADAQGAQLVTFSGDPASVLNASVLAREAAPHPYMRQESDKLEMIAHRPVVLREDISIYDRPLSTTPASNAAIRNAQDAEIGIAWDCEPCDLDL